MAKNKQPINPKAGKRLKELRKGAAVLSVPGMESVNAKITQARLSDFTGVSVTTISDIERNKAPLTYPIASLLIKAWPQVRPEWLMGQDDYMTPNDVPVLALGPFHWQYDCVVALLNSHGFSVHYDGKHTAIKGPGKTPSGRYAWITKEQWAGLVNAINNFPEFLLTQYFNEPPETVDLFSAMDKEVKTNGKKE